MSTPEPVHAIVQRHRLAKRIVFAPIAPVVRRWALTAPPTPAKAFAIRRLVVPGIGAAASDYVRDVPAGFRFAGNTRDLLGLMVNLFGVWEPNLTAFLTNRLRPGDTFIDVGANSGWFTTLGATCVGTTGRVAAIEASPVIARRLRDNLALNALGNVRVVVAAATAEAGEVDIVPGPAEHTGLTRISKHHSAAGVITVPADTLTKLLRDVEIETARIVKVDVEGAEYDVVAGLAPELARFPEACEFVVEVGPDRASGPDEVERLFATFTDAGYRPYFLPNFYDVRGYLLDPAATELAAVAALPAVEMDVVFSRRGGDTLGV
ncbi:MAG: FkbM family methyltransferase [Nocardioides sp.]